MNNMNSETEEVKYEDLNSRNDVVTIKQEDVDKADDLLSKIESFLITNKEASKKDDIMKTKLYGELKEYWKELSEHVNNIGFIFNISLDEYKILKKYIYQTCEYDHQTVFMGVQLKGDFFKRAENHIKNKEDILVTCNETVLIHHLFENGNFSVKGLSDKAYGYRNIMTAIGNVNKYFNELDIASKQAGDEINDWASGLDTEEVTKKEEPKLEKV